MSELYKKNVFIYTLACERRRLDAQKIRTYFSKNNYEIVDDPKDAHYIIFFTCAFVNKKTEQCLSIIKKLKKYDAELIIAGCLPDIARDKLKYTFSGRTIPTKNLDKIDNIFTDNKIKFRDIDDECSIWHNFNPIGVSKEPIGFFKILLREAKFISRIYGIGKKYFLKEFFENVYPFNVLYGEKSNYYISISRGCIHNCSYCSIRNAIGPLKSKPVDQCIKEFKLGLKEGYTDFILQADDIGTYGIDIKSSLPELLDGITKIDGNYTIRLENTHPRWIIKYINELEEILKRKKIRHITVSVQSGSNRILKLMRRSYMQEDVIDSISRLKKADPKVDIGAHLMVGFPSETREEFKETLLFFKKSLFDNGIIFSFSSADGTDADIIEPKISEREIRKRMKIASDYLKKTGYFPWYIHAFRGISFYKKYEF
jgi:tRNA A37 methylthiotransferase MiaB